MAGGSAGVVAAGGVAAGGSAGVEAGGVAVSEEVCGAGGVTLVLGPPKPPRKYTSKASTMTAPITIPMILLLLMFDLGVGVGRGVDGLRLSVMGSTFHFLVINASSTCRFPTSFQTVAINPCRPSNLSFTGTARRATRSP